jgi:hypothetical protein
MLLQQNSSHLWMDAHLYSPFKCNVNDMLFLHVHLLAMLVIASLLFALPFCLFQQGQGLSQCFQLHCKYWLKAIVIPVYIQIVFNKWSAMLQYPFISVATIWLETPKTMEHYPIVPTSIMIQQRYLNHPQTIIHNSWTELCLTLHKILDDGLVQREVLPMQFVT